MAGNFQIFGRKTTNRTHQHGFRKAVISTLAAALLLGSLIVQPLATRADDYDDYDDYIPGTTLYYYSWSGPVDVTATYSATDHTILPPMGSATIVFLSYGNGHIYDLNGNVIGFLE